MRPVKSKPKFHCDFCPKVLTEAAMERHEKMCWRNPDRYCDLCENRGYYEIEGGIPGYSITHKVGCPYCALWKPHWEKDGTTEPPSPGIKKAIEMARYNGEY